MYYIILPEIDLPLRNSLLTNTSEVLTSEVLTWIQYPNHVRIQSASIALSKEDALELSHNGKGPLQRPRPRKL